MGYTRSVGYVQSVVHPSLECKQSLVLYLSKFPLALMGVSQAWEESQTANFSLAFLSSLKMNFDWPLKIRQLETCLFGHILTLNMHYHAGPCRESCKIIQGQVGSLSILN